MCFGSQMLKKTFCAENVMCNILSKIVSRTEENPTSILVHLSTLSSPSETVWLSSPHNIFSKPERSKASPFPWFNLRLFIFACWNGWMSFCLKSNSQTDLPQRYNCYWISSMFFGSIGGVLFFKNHYFLLKTYPWCFFRT